jgi:L-fuculose-phosphate aldolase
MMILRAFQTTGHDLFAGQLNNSHSGNMSMRIGRMMAITRSGSMLHRLEHGDIIETLVDGDDSQSALASRERPVHQAIYGQTDARAIVHAHPPCLIALSFETDLFRPIDAEGSYFFSNGIPVIAVENAIASGEVAAKASPLLKRFPVVIIRGHGTFAIGNTLEEGFHFTSSLEHSARIAFFHNSLVNQKSK